jgi:hypothetical protein
MWNHEHLAVQPLLRQFQYVELHVIDSELNPGVATLAEALGATTTQLRLVFHMFGPACKSGSLSTVSGWLELLDALPHVGSLQITFEHRGCFPVFREPWKTAWFKPAVEQVVSSAIGACEQRGR